MKSFHVVVIAAAVAFVGANQLFANQLSNDKCENCHDKIVAPKTSTHYPVLGRACSVCHEVPEDHETTGDPTLVKTIKDPEKTCYQCHDRMDSGKETHMALRIYDQCLNCHNPHGSDFENLLRADAKKLCMDCHDSGYEGKSTHGPINSKKSCLTCHTPHSSDNDKLMTTTYDNINQFCVSCHDKEIATINPSTGNPRTIPNIKEKVESAGAHSPAAGNCLRCHVKHASQYDRLLNKNYSMEPVSRYIEGDAKTPNTYALCLDCHTKSLVRENGRTYFRKDKDDWCKGTVSKNLHFLHVVEPNVPEFGHNCRTCHDPHGSPQPKLIATHVGFFKPSDKMKLRFDVSSSGGTCTVACHSKSASYSRK